jgi:erythromycin esterase-like protein
LKDIREKDALEWISWNQRKRRRKVMDHVLSSTLTNAIREGAQPLTGANTDYDGLMDFIGDAPIVLLGEATHGTHEFYRARAQITNRLIHEKGFSSVAVEADWPDAYRVNRYVRGISDDPTGEEALSGFKRFPIWMWRNIDVLAFIEWLRGHNQRLPKGSRQTGFYGLDLYSLYASIDAVIAYLEKVDPEGAKRARYRYSCFDHYGEESQAYGYAAHFGLSQSCEDEVINQLVEMQRRMPAYIKRDGHMAEDDFFYAEQNARLVKNAEQYYRSMFQDRVSSWNVRDRHMAEILGELIADLKKQDERAKVVVWEHNSHIGDARATTMGHQGELNVGQLAREAYGDEVVLIGLSTYTGTVTAASDWNAPYERKYVRPAHPGSYEHLFHETAQEMRQSDFFIPLRDRQAIRAALRGPRLERAIGVIYLPQTERISHYFRARLPAQFDAIIHFDETLAVEPLDRTSMWESGEELPETYPYAV